MKIKSRKQREAIYNEKYGDISLDMYQRLKDELGEKLTEEVLEEVLHRIKEAHDVLEYNCLRFTFYELPIQAHRPRTNFNTMNLHVPNAKENFDAVDKFINSLNEELKIISSPMKIVLNAYAAMPSGLNPVDLIMYETENDYAIGKPDFDNILKAYCDMIQKHIILDDDLVVSCVFNKWFSLKPRVVLDIIFPNGVISEHTYKTITNRKTYKDLKDNVVDVELLISPYRQKKKKRK